MVLKQLDLRVQKNESRHRVYTFTKNNSKWITDPKCKMQNTRLLEANIGEHLDDPGLGDNFLDIKSKIHERKRKKKPDKLDFIKI